MTLYKQIVTLITVFLVLISTITLFAVLNYNKELLEQQLSSNAKNSSSFLGLTISKNADFDAIATIEGMVSSVLDNGYYESIIIKDLDEKTLLQLEAEKIQLDAPVWFKSFFEVDAPSSSANLMNGWSQFGTIDVVVHKEFANNQLWKIFKTISFIFISSIFGILVLIYFFLNRLLQPLKKLRNQAEAIDNNEFIIEKDMPYTIEFRKVVQAMNKTISKMENIFNNEVQTLKKYNDILYKDKDTGLGNKNYLLLKLDTYLKNSHGLLVFMEIKNIIAFKKSVGFKKYSEFIDFIIDKINNSFLDNKDIVLSKFEDGTIAILLPNRYFEDVHTKFDKIEENINSYLEKEINTIYNVDYGFGIANYSQNIAISQILSKSDQALLLAMDDQKCNHYYLKEETRFTKQEWIEVLEWAFDNDGIKFDIQDIINLNNNESYMREFYIRLFDKSNEEHLPGEFLSIVSAMGWMPKLEKQMLLKVFDSTTIHHNKYSVLNLSEDFVRDKNNVDWLIQTLETNFNKDDDTIFCFECLNADILSFYDEYKYLSKKLANTKHKIAIESFTFDSNELDYLKSLKPFYLKISKSYLVENDMNVTSNALKNITSTIGAFIIVKHVETQKEFDTLKESGFNFLQGKYIDSLKDEK